MNKILYIIDCYKNPLAGTEGQLLKLIQGLDTSKFEANFIVFRDSDYIAENNFPIPVDTLGIQRLISPLSWWKLLIYLKAKKKQGYKLAHIYFNDASMICPILLKLLGYKVIISRRDMGYWYNWLNLLVLKFNALFVDSVIVNSKAVKKITVLKERYKASRVTVIYNGYLELKKAEHVPVSAGSFSGNENEMRIVLVANIRSIKRIEDAVHALKQIKSSVPNAVLYIVGDGDQAVLKALSERLGVVTSVRFLGARSDVLHLLSNFHIGILCSESEGFSNTLIEYMQSGLPVVCSSVGGNPEIVDHGVNGYLYEVGDIQSLSSFLVELLIDENMLTRMGQAGKEKVRSLYNITTYIEQHQEVYSTLLLKS